MSWQRLAYRSRGSVSLRLYPPPPHFSFFFENNFVRRAPLAVSLGFISKEGPGQTRWTALDESWGMAMTWCVKKRLGAAHEVLLVLYLDVGLLIHLIVRILFHLIV